VDQIACGIGWRQRYGTTSPRQQISYPCGCEDPTAYGPNGTSLELAEDLLFLALEKIHSAAGSLEDQEDASPVGGDR
jgi:hypothetical protein